MDTYLVGGAVRDELLGLPVSDRDWVVVGATTQMMLDLGYTQVGRDFPVFLHPETREEHALARTERNSGPGHKGFTVHAGVEVTLEEDLIRRDLTINAMARAADGTLIDPYGGYDDLQAKRLRHVSEAFSEDPLRVLRVARFAAQLPGTTVAPATAALMQRLVAAGALRELPAERVAQELDKLLSKRLPPARFLEVLRDAGGLDDWFAELAHCSGVVPEGLHDADLRFAASGVKFTTAHGKLNLPAEYGLSWLLPRMVGLSHANDLLLSSRVFLSDEAAQLGLVNSVHEADALLPFVYDYARTLRDTVAPESLRQSRWQIYRDLHGDIAASVQDAEKLLNQMMQQPDYREGIAAFIEKRPPKWGGGDA